MFTFNGKQFAKNDDEFTSSLFTPGGTCQGFYKRTANGVRLYDMQRELTGFIVDNKHNERFIVSAGTNSEGRAFFMNGASSSLEQWLGVLNMSGSEERALIDAALK